MLPQNELESLHHNVAHDIGKAQGIIRVGT